MEIQSSIVMEVPSLEEKQISTSLETENNSEEKELSESHSSILEDNESTDVEKNIEKKQEIRKKRDRNESNETKVNKAKKPKKHSTNEKSDNESTIEKSKHRHRKPLFPKKHHKEGCERSHRFKSGTRALLQIRRLQKYSGTLIPRSTIKSITARILREEAQVSFRIKRNAINAIHLLLENYAVQRFKTAQTFAIHRKCQGVQERDFQLAGEYLNIDTVSNRHLIEAPQK